MASYAMLNLRLRPSENLQRMIAVRTLFGRKKKYITPGETRHQLKPPPDEKGYMKYTRYWSNIAAFEPQLRTGDTLSRLNIANTLKYLTDHFAQPISDPSLK